MKVCNNDIKYNTYRLHLMDLLNKCTYIILKIIVITIYCTNKIIVKSIKVHYISLYKVLL